MPWSEAKYRDGRLEADGPGRTLIPTPGEIVALGRNQGVIPGLTKYPETRIPGEVVHLAWGPWLVPSRDNFSNMARPLSYGILRNTRGLGISELTEMECIVQCLLSNVDGRLEVDGRGLDLYPNPWRDAKY